MGLLIAEANISTPYVIYFTTVSIVTFSSVELLRRLVHVAGSSHI